MGRSVPARPLVIADDEFQKRTVSDGFDAATGRRLVDALEPCFYGPNRTSAGDDEYAAFGVTYGDVAQGRKHPFGHSVVGFAAVRR